jgi:integrase/recombinase XerC
LFRFLVENEYLERNPAAVLRTPKKREALPDVPDRRELKRLLGAPARQGAWRRQHRGKRERDRLLLALFAYAGLRRSELLGLDWDDVDLERRLIRVRQAKGGRQRVVPLQPALVPLLLTYLDTRLPLAERALFVASRAAASRSPRCHRPSATTRGSPGVDERKRIRPHTLRHVFASELLGAGANLRQIQELLGHKHLDSTQRYTRVTAHQLRGAIKRLRWAA